MLTFISHSFKDEAVYSTLCLALDAAGVKRWDPSSMSLGESLSSQLQQAINNCHTCVFLATRRSVESPWCGAELGAFWGAGKRVLLFMADPDLAETVLPPQFKGTLRANTAAALIEALKKGADDEMFRQQAKAATPTFYASSAEYGSEKDWDLLLHQTADRFDLLGLTLEQWRKTNKFREKILGKAATGCNIRFLLMHEDNSALKSMFSEQDLPSVRLSIQDSARELRQLQAASEKIAVRQIRSGLAYFSLTCSDQFLVLTQYLSAENWGYGPTWRCAPGSLLFDAATKEFEHLWKNHTTTAESMVLGT
jgi:hypothetical protein